MRRRPTGDRAIGIIDTTVAGTQEELGFGLPTHWAAQVGAADGERGELCLVLATQPQGRLSGLASPRQRRWFGKIHLHRLTDPVLVDRPEIPPDVLAGVE